MTKYRVKLNVPMLNFKKSDIIVLTDRSGGIKLNAFWRKRIKDSETDNCLEILNNVKTSKDHKLNDKKSIDTNDNLGIKTVKKHKKDKQKY